MRNKVFIDSSVIIAGLASNKGGAHEVLVLAELKVIIPFISEDVVTEVLRNVQKKLPGALEQYYLLFKTLPFIIVDFDNDTLESAQKMINEKDAPILAAALSANVDWLLSLDKHFLWKTWAGKVDFQVCSPGTFLEDLRSMFD